jgi:hypothetical protein
MPNYAKAKRLDAVILDALRDEVPKLRARITFLESLLKCVHCGHLRHEHFEDDGPCHGGREGVKEGEGEYCMCPGFESAEG